MASLLTIPVIIAVGDVSTYLAGNNNAKGVLFGRRLSSPKSSLEILMATDSLRWGYEGYPTDDTLRGTANYVLWMCGRYSLEYQYIISGSGGGSVVPVVGAIPSPIQFIVNASTSFIIDGQSAKTISTFTGYNLLFTRGGITQSDVNTEPSYYSWNKTTGSFVCTPSANTGELFQLYAI